MLRLPSDQPENRPAYFWWFVANTLALAIALLTWAVCLHVFGSPEVPRNHRILEKLGRTPVLRHHTVLTAPNATALGPRELYARYDGLDATMRNSLNAALMRNYLMNFKNPLLLYYIQGEYQVEQVTLLRDEDVISRGFAVRARALVKPDDFSEALPYPVVIEYVFPTSKIDMASGFSPGDILDVRKSPNCAAILHVARESIEDEALWVFTVVPIAYGKYQLDEQSAFEITVPDRVNPGGKLPIFDGFSGIH